MHIYILFKNIDVSKIANNKKYFSDMVKSIAQKELCCGNDIEVLFGEAKNINKDVQIIIDWIPQTVPFSRYSKREMLINFKEQIGCMLKSNFPELTYAEYSIMADPDYVVDLVHKKSERTEVDNNDISDVKVDDEFDYHKKAEMYKATEPAYTFDRVILPSKIIGKIEEALSIILCEQRVFSEWGLYTIQPNPSSAMSFFGPSGTGKTMAAEAIAEKIHKKILKVSYADIESKFHGEGPKMVKAIFLAAERENAVLFIDEADSLLSKRLTNVTQGSEQAINSMRSQLLICLEEFKGIVIFATNLVINYDQAFLTRLVSIEFELPDVDCREKIWNVHIKGNGINIPLGDDVDTRQLAVKYEFCGREIRKAVIAACVRVAMQNRNVVTQVDFIAASDKIREEEIALKNAKDNTKPDKSKCYSWDAETEKALKETIKSKMKEHRDS